MAQPTAGILVVGLNRALLAHAPRMAAFASGCTTRELRPVLPAVTCSVQASMLTGLLPREHGIVGNGWYDRTLAEVQFWKQSSRLVGGERVWETARRGGPAITCAKLFLWYNMYSSADWSVTPRPMYKADGRKLPDVYSQPPELRERLQAELGPFPLFDFWGPRASIRSSRWIADATLSVHRAVHPTLTLIYLPHLDYALQRLGPGHAGIPSAVREIDGEAGRLLDHFTGAGVRVLLLSEYGIEAVDAPVHINRALRREGALRVRSEQGLELLDAGASAAFAVADHQVAHVYVREAGDVSRIAAICRDVPGVERVLDREAQAAEGIDHARGGELVLVARRGAWFAYYYWLDDARAPDFARTVDIHRKPGYDPVELVLNPRIPAAPLYVAGKLLARRLGMRTLLDVIPLDASLIRGSHGRVDQPADERPLLIGEGVPAGSEPLPCTAVRDVILSTLAVGD